MTMTEQTTEQQRGDLDSCDGCPEITYRSVEPVTITAPAAIAGRTVWLCRSCRLSIGFSG